MPSLRNTQNTQNKLDTAQEHVPLRMTQESTRLQMQQIPRVPRIPPALPASSLSLARSTHLES